MNQQQVIAHLNQGDELPTHQAAPDLWATLQKRKYATPADQPHMWRLYDAFDAWEDLTDCDKQDSDLTPAQALKLLREQAAKPAPVPHALKFREGKWQFIPCSVLAQERRYMVTCYGPRAFSLPPAIKAECRVAYTLLSTGDYAVTLTFSAQPDQVVTVCNRLVESIACVRISELVPVLAVSEGLTRRYSWRSGQEVATRRAA
jgi:hypothetical protein